MRGCELCEQGADRRGGTNPGTLAVAAGGDLDAGGGKAQAHAAGRLERKVEGLGRGGGLAGLRGRRLGVEGFEAALDAEGARLSRRGGSKHIEEGHEHGLGLFPSFQCMCGSRAEQEREGGASE